MSNIEKMTSEDIKQHLSTNQNIRKVMLHNFNSITKVNDLLTLDDIYTLKDHSFYDALHDYNYPFNDVLNDFYLLHLDEKFNSNDVMIWLCEIYS